MNIFKIITSVMLCMVTFAASAATDTTGTAAVQRKKKLVAPPPQPLFIPQFGRDMTFVAVYEYKSQKEDPNMDEEDRKLNAFRNRFPKVRKIETAQTGALRRDVRHYTVGESTEIWRYDNMRLTHRFTEGTHTPLSYDVQPAGNVDDPPDLEELSWITPDTYEGEVVFKGIRCHLYQNHKSAAYVNVNSLLPVAVETDTLTVTYTYGPPPNPPLKLDPKLLAGLKKLRNVMAGVED
ncbi:MAG: hypothetical protein LBK60_01635 [Verrucomicrobiales bacterium]|nr:hypothetical protein [Verrucomicrobiales bacterium]